jgi:hypothetical protein
MTGAVPAYAGQIDPGDGLLEVAIGLARGSTGATNVRCRCRNDQHFGVRTISCRACSFRISDPARGRIPEKPRRPKGNPVVAGGWAFRARCLPSDATNPILNILAIGSQICDTLVETLGQRSGFALNSPNREQMLDS